MEDVVRGGAIRGGLWQCADELQFGPGGGDFGGVGEEVCGHVVLEGVVSKRRIVIFVRHRVPGNKREGGVAPSCDEFLLFLGKQAGPRCPLIWL